MSILGSILGKILGHPGAAGQAGAGAGASGSVSASEGASGTPASATARTPPTDSGPAATTPPAAGRPAIPAEADAPAHGPAATVDVEALLNGLAAEQGERLDWRHSIVDMLKLLGIDSSLAARQTLAQELNYAGDLHDSASMNIWLRKAVMLKLAENGGKVPDEFKA